MALSRTIIYIYIYIYIYINPYKSCGNTYNSSFTLSLSKWPKSVGKEVLGWPTPTLDVRIFLIYAVLSVDDANSIPASDMYFR
jgi:hypothetical protein